ncbi:hypothetical protein K3495_g12561 [Podosphaera aphanis]|nr:hypothetical protein K3495_g12561 [Podosphaera aphanis]
MPNDDEKPSPGAPQDLVILDITFATADEIVDSIKESIKKTETAPGDTARNIFDEITVASQAHACIKEFQKRLHELREHSTVNPDVQAQIRNLFLFHINTTRPDLASRCKNLTLENTLSECRASTSGDKPSSKTKNDSGVKCSYCQILGHSVNECRKKKRAEKENKKNMGGSKILSVNKPSHSSYYQLDTAADAHVSGNIEDFSYSKSSQLIGEAGGGQVTTDGYGDMFLPTADGKLEILSDAVHLPGETTRVLSTLQPEKQGFSINWPENYRDIELLRPDGSICAYFRREAGRLIWKPRSTDSVKSVSNSTKRNWHIILGHPGKKALTTALADAKITGYKSPENCETCIKTKITVSKGGQKSLSSVATDSSVPNATLFVLAVDEYTSWKWAWPIYSKKTVPTKIRQFLEYLKTNHSQTPEILHTDSGSEFSNVELQEILLNRGTTWHRFSSHAPEQNGIAERAVRTVTEKMRALHLQSGIPVRLWPLIPNAAINILNATPNKIAPKSPYYAVYHRLPNIKRFYPFGCRAYWLDPDRNKLNSKAKEGIYVGTEFSTGNIIFNPQSNKTIARRDIRVHENVFPLQPKFLSLHASNRKIIKTILNGPNAERWNQAMDSEMENMARNKVWTLVPPSEANGNVMTGKWTLKEKHDGQLKARWCARGFSEPFAENTYADVLLPTTLRMLLAFASLKHLHIRHVDITAAFLHADLDTL